MIVVISKKIEILLLTKSDKRRGFLIRIGGLNNSDSISSKFKMITFLFVVFLVAVSSAAEFYKLGVQGNRMEDIVIRSLEYVRFLLKKHDPYPLPSIPDLHLTDSEMNLVFSTSNVLVSKSADFIIDYVKVDPVTLKSIFQTTIPLSLHQGSFKVSGMAWNKTVEASGTYMLNYTNFVQSGTIQLAQADKSIQVKDLSLDFSIGDFKLSKFIYYSLNLNKDQADELLNKLFMKYIEENIAFVAEQMAGSLKEIINMLLKVN